MSDKVKTKKKKSPLWPVWLLLKIIGVFVVLVAIGLFLLAQYGGNSPELKKMVEDLASEKTGMITTIGQFNNLQFYPNVNVDIEQLEMRKTAEAKPSVTAGVITISVGFWDTILGAAKLKNIAVRDVTIEKGMVTQDALKISSLAIVDEDKQGETAELIIKGSVGSKLLNVITNIAAYGNGTKRTYDLGKERRIDITLGTLSAIGNMSNPNLMDIELTDLTVKDGKQTLVKGDVTIKAKGDGRSITGDITSGKGSRAQPNLYVGPGVANGTLNVPQVYVDDIAPLLAGVASLSQILPQKASSGIDLSGQDVDITINADKIIMDGSTLGSQTVKLRVVDGTLKAEGTKGKIYGGDTTWTAVVKPSDKTHRLDIAARMNDLPLGSVLKEKTGKTYITSNVDTIVNLGANATRWDQFADRLSGRATVVLNEGQMESGVINLWGGGLGSLIIPSFKPQDELQLACSITDISIKDNVATLDTMFLDTARVTIKGSGTYNMKSDALNVKIKPYTKSISIGDISAAVRVTGPLSKPSVKADIADVTKKVGTVLLGAANPAFLALAAGDVNFGSLKDKLKEGLKAQEDELKAEVKTAPQATDSNPCAVISDLSGNFAAGVQPRLTAAK